MPESMPPARPYTRPTDGAPNPGAGEREIPAVENSGHTEPRTSTAGARIGIHGGMLMGRILHGAIVVLTILGTAAAAQPASNARRSHTKDIHATGADHRLPSNAVPTFRPSPLRPAPGARLIYVSAELGSDANPGTRARPLRTIRHALELARSGTGDWILLRRGDIFRESVVWNLDGAAYDAPAVLTDYGTHPRRPVITPDADASAFDISAASRNHVAIRNIAFHAPPGGSHADGIRIVNDTGSNILIENCLVKGFKNNINLRAGNDVRIRACTIIDAHAPFGGHSQGIFVNGTDNLLIEFCTLDHNGWADDPRSPPTIFNHNIYTRGSHDDPLVRPVIRYNLSARASSWGITVSSDDAGGVVQPLVIDNLVYRCANGIVLGAGTIGAILSPRIVRNIMVETGARPSGIAQAFGMIIEGTTGATIAHNIIVDVAIDEGTREPITILPPDEPNGNINLTQIATEVYRWPERSDGPIATMHAYEIAHAIESLIDEARPLAPFDRTLTAPAINTWLRASRNDPARITDGPR